jgi:methyl-accepting chemotaxis protein
VKFTVGKKLLGLVGIFIVLLAVIWVSSTLNLKSVQHAEEQAIKKQEDVVFICQKEIDHLNWVNALTDVFTIDKDFDKQLDPKKCAFGKWYYDFVNSDDFRKLPEDTQRALRNIEEPHKLLHLSAAKIKEKFNPVDVSLNAMLADRWIDHLRWLEGLDLMLMTGKEFTGGLDPKGCAFGKWYFDFHSDNPELMARLKKIEEPHAKLHHYGADISEAYKSGNKAKALQIYHDDLLPTLAELNGLFDNARAYIEDAINEKEESIEIYHTETMAHLEEVKANLNTISEAYTKQAEEIKEEARSKATSSIILNLGVAVAAVIIGLVLGMVISRGITKPLGQALLVTEKIADYDLTSDPLGNKSTDEVGDISRALDTMNQKLTEMIAVLANNTEQLASAATEISSSAEELSAGITEQTNQTTQVSAAVEEMTATIVENSRNTAEAADKAREASDKSQEGGRLAENTSQGMQEIVESSDVTSHNVQNLAEKATAIGEIIKVIDDIADQTNLLALNAAIEAARAGEQGRGFAVVADEVRKLAERTTRATKEVAETIKEIQADVANANDQISDSKTTVDRGKELVMKTNASLTDIFTAIETVQDMMRQVATASEQQSSAAEQISQNVENVNRITKESATGAEQAATAAEQLNRQAVELRQLVSNFKIKQGVGRE